MGRRIKQIAIILGAINLDNQKRLLAGMEMAAKEFDCNLFVFTNYVGTKETEESILAATQILKLPEFNQFDGAILVPNTIHNPVALERVIKELNIAGIPLVSIDRKLDGMSYVGINSYDAEYEMVEHFLYHGYTNIIYVTGAISVSSEARKRYQAYQDALQNNGMPFYEENVYEGAFTLESGIKVGTQILKEGKHPEAIICGNDDMAHGIIEVFKKAGYKIPEDVRIAGFDNGEMAQMNSPMLTSVDKNQEEVGYKAVYEIMELLTGKDIENYEMPCKLVYRESCGCSNDLTGMIDFRGLAEDLKKKYIDQQMQTIFMADVVRGITTEFAKTHTPDQLIDVLKKHIGQIGIEKFYLCLCDRKTLFVLPESNFGQDIDVLQVNDDYTEEIEVALALENGQFKTYDKVKKGMVLPEECKNARGGNTFVVNQIYYENCCYGYAVCERLEGVVTSGLYYSMLMEIGVGLENIRKQVLLKAAVDKLNGMWCFDSMTHLYNRSGFLYAAKNYLNRFIDEDKWVFIIFIDADGLKKINDTMGHEAGDLLIHEIGSVVHKNVYDDMLGMRYGGDEFVIFGGFAVGEKQKVERVVESIREDIRLVNASGKYKFTVSVSMGGSGWRARDVDNLGKLIEQADKQMYEEKRMKKRY